MPADDEAIVERETEAAAREAAEIGGRADPDRDPARAPVEEAGGGEAEGFEDAEKALREHAEHREPGGNPKYDRPAPEPEASGAAYGEADHAEANEDVNEGD
ncbi:MAG TPA: hypothetical protein VHF58_07120 [Solirubrobacterales bacterium]|nr:hypothetical protein [Solirubrobacterales bacterium]